MLSTFKITFYTIHIHTESEYVIFFHMILLNKMPNIWSQWPVTCTTRTNIHLWDVILWCRQTPGSTARTSGSFPSIYCSGCAWVHSESQPGWCPASRNSSDSSKGWSLTHSNHSSQGWSHSNLSRKGRSNKLATATLEVWGVLRSL